MIHGDDAAYHTRALRKHERRVNTLIVGKKYLWGMIVGHQIAKSQENGSMGIGCRGARVKAKVNDRIYLENRIAAFISGNRGVHCGVIGGALVFLGRISLERVLGRDPVDFCSHQEALRLISPKFVVRAGFGKVAVDGV